jgi:hypothetical protein
MVDFAESTWEQDDNSTFDWDRGVRLFEEHRYDEWGQYIGPTVRRQPVLAPPGICRVCGMTDARCVAFLHNDSAAIAVHLRGGA